MQVGAHDGNLQVGWITDKWGNRREEREGKDEDEDEEDEDGGMITRQHPVFLDCFRPSGGVAMYRVSKSSNY